MKVFEANKILLCLPSLPPPTFNPMENEIDRKEEDSWHLPLSVPIYQLVGPSEHLWVEGFLVLIF